MISLTSRQRPEKDTESSAPHKTKSHNPERQVWLSPTVSCILLVEDQEDARELAAVTLDRIHAHMRQRLR